EDVAIVEPLNMTLTGHGEAEQISGGHASAILSGVSASMRMKRSRAVRLLSMATPSKSWAFCPRPFRFPKATQLGAMVEFPSRADYFTPLGLDPEQFSPLGEFDFA